TTLVDDWESQDGTSDVIQPLALGGITNGVTNLELCAAYASIANGGMYGIPLFFTKILDRNGKVLLDASGRSASAEATSISGKAGFGSFTRVLQDSTAFLLTSAMENVVSSTDGTAYGSVSAAGQPVAGKTGTTSSYKDIWFVGYTPYYTCSVWGGYDNNQSLPDGSIWHSYSRILWSAVMERIHAELSTASFSIPESITTVTLCSDSHLPAQDGVCPSIYTEYFAKGTEPDEVCSIHETTPETESEISEDLIYPDLLKELFPESEQESETESENESESESESGNKNGSESESESELGNKSESESENRNEAETENTNESETNSLDDLISRLAKINP
ncbi:MAG: hypothetical protein LIO94_03955, partial [Clostridiales bacterium]|nr:hypothetical protein [Clostridiales bacterium]